MGAHCLLQAAANEPDRFRCLSLFDPVIYPPSVYETGVSFDDDKNPAARRRSNWGSPQEMFDKFKDREPFSNWVPAALRDYCDYGLVEHGGSYELACPPQIEAAIYPLATRANIIDRLGRIECPVQVVRAEPRDMAKPVEDFLMSPTRPDLASQFVRGEDIYLPQYSHFMPMENPALAASIIRRDWQPELAS
jgi:lipase